MDQIFVFDDFCKDAGVQFIMWALKHAQFTLCLNGY